MHIQKFVILIVLIIFAAGIMAVSTADNQQGRLAVADSIASPFAGSIAVSSSSDINNATAMSGYKFKDWGRYESVNIQGVKYCSGYVESANESHDLFFKESTGMSSLSGEYLEKILIDNSTVMNVTSGTTLKLQEGYELAIKSIDIDGNKIYVELVKNGSVIDSRVVSASKDGATIADKTYYYENTILGGEKKLVTLAVHFQNAFSQSGQNMATIDGIWQISESPVQYKPSYTANNVVPYKSVNYMEDAPIGASSMAPTAAEPAETVTETEAKTEALPEAELEETVTETEAKTEALPEAEPEETVTETEANFTSAETATDGRKPIGLGQIADDIPDKMYAKRVYTVTAYVTKDIKENITMRPDWDRTPAVANAKVGDNMSVTLSGGDNFIITPLSEKIQSLTLEGNATWQWHVEALVLGEQTLSLSADIILDNGEPHHYRTYDHRVKVSVDDGTIGTVIQENWQWLVSSLAAAIIALAGFLKWLYPLIKSRSKKEE